MKFFILALVFFSLNVNAKPVDGKITYKLQNGDLVDRQVVIEVPSRGQGEVVLSGESFEWRTKDFKSFSTLGKDTFVATFDTDFMGTKSKLIFEGTYLKGNNRLHYSGDIYKFSVQNKKLRHVGIFSFSFDR